MESMVAARMAYFRDAKLHTIRFQFATGKRQSPLKKGFFQLSTALVSGDTWMLVLGGVFEVTLQFFLRFLSDPSKGPGVSDCSLKQNRVYLFFVQSPLKMFECATPKSTKENFARQHEPGWRQATRIMLSKLQALRKQPHTQAPTGPLFCPSCGRNWKACCEHAKIVLHRKWPRATGNQ